MQFYTGDWMKDPNLRSVSLASKGLWMDMLCLMHESDRRGYLQRNGKPITQDQLARMAGCSSEEVSQCLEELESSGVFSRTKNGIIFSRRMKKDEEKRRKAIEYGRLGGNPALTGLVKGHDNLKQGSSVSFSTSVENSLSRAYVSNGEDKEAPETRPPIDIPDDLLELAQHAIGLTPEALLLGWLRVNKWPADWIARAIVKAKERGIKQTEMPTYVPGILRNWTKNGGPEDDQKTRGSVRNDNGRGEKPRKPGKFAGLDPWAEPERGS